MIAQKLTERLGQAVVVDNRPGVTGNIGADIAAKSTPDGHALFIGLTAILAPSARILIVRDAKEQGRVAALYR